MLYWKAPALSVQAGEDEVALVWPSKPGQGSWGKCLSHPRMMLSTQCMGLPGEAVMARLGLRSVRRIPYRNTLLLFTDVASVGIAPGCLPL